MSTVKNQILEVTENVIDPAAGLNLSLTDVDNKIQSQVVEEATAARTLALTDHNKWLYISTAACTITIPEQSSVVWFDDAEIRGSGKPVTFVAGTGVTISKAGAGLVSDDGGSWLLKRVAQDVWHLSGDVA